MGKSYERPSSSLEIEARIDALSLKDQGIERELQCHKWPAVSGMEGRGMKTEVARQIELEMAALAQQRLIHDRDVQQERGQSPGPAPSKGRDGPEIE